MQQKVQILERLLDKRQCQEVNRMIHLVKITNQGKQTSFIQNQYTIILILCFSEEPLPFSVQLKPKMSKNSMTSHRRLNATGNK